MSVAILLCDGCDSFQCFELGTPRVMCTGRFVDLEWHSSSTGQGRRRASNVLRTSQAGLRISRAVVTWRNALCEVIREYLKSLKILLNGAPEM
jgi:hypothetical protein